MIAFFPRPYEDELLYSQLCRYHVQSGHLSYVNTCDEIFKKRTVIPSIEFVNSLTNDCISWLNKYATVEEIVLDHTMLKAYIRFYPKERRITAYNAIKNMVGSYNTIFHIPQMGKRYLRYCPLCANEDREKYKETYWHRIPQVLGMTICYKHRCYLKNSSVQIGGRMSPNFYDAESRIPKDDDYEICKNDVEVRLAEYNSAVFWEPLDMESEYPIGLYLQSKLDDEYISESRLLRSATRLYDDYKILYNNQHIMHPTRMQKVFNGYRFDTFDIVQIAFFENISPYDLTHPPKDYEVKGIERLYRELADRYTLDIGVVKSVGEEILKYSRKKTYIQRKCGVHGIKWEELDDRRLQDVVEFVDSFMNQEIPQKLTYRMVERALKLPQKQIYKLPKCKAYVDANLESYEQYWARRMEWAYDELSKAKSHITLTDIRRKVSLTKSDTIDSLPYIRNEKVRELIERAK